MKFSWKLFVSTMFICILCFSIGSFLLINITFRSSLNQEVSNAYDLSDVIGYSLSDELQGISELQNHLAFSGIENLNSIKNRWIIKAAQGLTVNDVRGDMSFRITDQEQKVIYASTKNAVGSRIITQITATTRGYELTKTDTGIYIHAIRPVTLLNKQYYVEVFRDVSPIFENRVQQQQIYLNIIVFMIVIGVVLTLMAGQWIMRPIINLSEATRHITEGNLYQRVAVDSHDEIGILSQNFNTMAAHLEEKVRELEDETSKQENFVASFSHELKTPLTSMIGYADMLRSKKMDQDQIVLCGNYIFAEGKRLEDLSMKLLEMVILKHQQIQMRTIPAADFFTDIEWTMKPAFASERIRFNIKADHANLLIEPELLKTVCINLLDNARKAIDQDGEVSLEGKTTAKGCYAIIISDNGKGMDESELSKITQAFYMVDKSRARTQGGAGLGLAICDEIVKLHGGTMEFESKPAAGTRVTIHLKGADADE